MRGFRVEEILGTGGMGNVYLGRHETIDSKVAIKVLHPEYVSDADMERRFLDEARAVNRVEHPGLVKITDCGQEEGIGVFLVMELLNGRTLRDRIKQEGPLPPLEVVRVVGQVVSALEAVHRVGIIHRDLKPENIMLIPDPYVPGGERVKILDFGIAKLLEGGGHIGEVTRTGHIFGSPMYMSPEQCADTKSVDHRTDIYALGVIAYELLCGSTPFVADSIYDLVRQHLTTRPALPTSRSHQVPEAMGQAILKALAFELEDRYPNVAAFGASLEASLERQPASETLQGGSSSERHAGDSDAETTEQESEETESLGVAPTMMAGEAQSVGAITTEPPVKLRQSEAHQAITKDSAGRKIVIMDRPEEADSPGDGGPSADTEMATAEVDSDSPTLKPTQDTLPVIGEVSTEDVAPGDQEDEASEEPGVPAKSVGPADTVTPPVEVPWHRRAAIPAGLALAGLFGVVLVLSLDDTDPVRIETGGVGTPSEVRPKPPPPKAGSVAPPAAQRTHAAEAKRPQEVAPDAGRPRVTTTGRPRRKARPGKKPRKGGQPARRPVVSAKPIPPKEPGPAPVKKIKPGTATASPKARKDETDFRFHKLPPGHVKKKSPTGGSQKVHRPGGLKKDLRYRRIKGDSVKKD